jgi:hypothetical protein
VPFRELAGEFQFRLQGVDSAFRTDEAEQNLRPPAVVAVKESREPGQEAQDFELRQRICAELIGVGVYVRPEEADVVRAVAKLAEVVKEISSTAPLPDVIEGLESESFLGQSGIPSTGSRGLYLWRSLPHDKRAKCSHRTTVSCNAGR